MAKLKFIAATVLTVAAAAVGGLTAAPTAAAQPKLSDCEGLLVKGRALVRVADSQLLMGNWFVANFYYELADAYYDDAADCLRNL
jgi:hypothetical protein